MVTRVVHLFDAPIRVRDGERIRHEVSFRGEDASFALTSVPPGNLLLNQDAPGGPTWRRDWRSAEDPTDSSPVHSLVMAFVKAISYRWRVFHIAGGAETLRIDVEYTVDQAGNENTNDAVQIVG